MFRCLLLVVIFAASVSAQRKLSFDIVTYEPPAGWTESKSSSGRLYIKEDGAKFCMITLLKPVDSDRSSRENFEAVWQAFVKEQFGATAQPSMEQPGQKGGWTAEIGIAPFETADLKGAAILKTLTGNGKLVAVLVLTNTEDFNSQIERFADKIELPAISASKVSPPTTNQSPAEASRFVGRWNRSGSASPSYADPASWGTAGYTKNRYQFNGDGTYLYTERTFRYSYQNIIVVKENGKYTVSGDSITIMPSKSTITAYAKAGGTDTLGSAVKTQNRPLEKVTYKFAFHFFSGIQEWNLVLMADSPTQRDGAFSNNKSYENAWYFDQKFTEGDLTSIRGN